MTLSAFQCPAQLRKKMAYYTKLSPPELKGSLWDAKDDKELTQLKHAIKEHYLKQQNYTCAYCRQQNIVEHHMAWDAEHIIPKNGYPEFMFEPRNLCIACKDCNGEKLEKNVLKNPNRKTFPSKSEDYIIANPHFDRMEDHLNPMPNSMFFLPKTDKGRKTVEICGLLRFVYRYADYGIAPIKLKTHLQQLTTELQNTSDPAQETFLVSQIESCTSEIRRLAIEAARKKYEQANIKAAAKITNAAT